MERKSINRTHGPDAPHGEFSRVGKRARKVRRTTGRKPIDSMARTQTPPGGMSGMT